MCERDKLPKLTTNSKLIKLQEEINGVTEEHSYLKDQLVHNYFKTLQTH